MIFDIYNRRYIGNKRRIVNKLEKEIQNFEANSFVDLFAGSGTVANAMMDQYDEIIINDFLRSNYIIYDAFFGNSNFSSKKILDLQKKFNKVQSSKENYFSTNYGDKFFSRNDAIKIGYIREKIETLKVKGEINKREFNILLASLIYSMDRISNTVGHYEAYLKNFDLEDVFIFSLIKPRRVNSKVKIFNSDSNELVKKISADIIYIDPPYNSRQYGRFYHVIENLVEWQKPELFGVAMKPAESKMSEYSRSSAPEVFKDLIDNINAKYIVVSYNNSFEMKSNSSSNKISYEQITSILKEKGKMEIVEIPHKFFNSGKTNIKNHLEFLFIVEVDND